MTAAELHAILEHLPPDLPVHIAGHGEVTSARRPVDPWTLPALYLDVKGPLLGGRFRDLRTLRVRLEALGAAS